MDFNQPNILPDVFLRVISVLEDGNGPISWTITRSWKGQLSLSVTYPPTRHVKSKSLESTQQDSEKAAPAGKVNSSKRKKKSPSQIKRDRERWKKWRQERKSRADLIPSQPVVCDQLESEAQSSAEQDITIQCQENSKHLEQPVHVDEVVKSAGTGESTFSCSDIDSDDDIDGIELPNFCSNCNLKPLGVILKRCSRCHLSQYCSVKCQKENWKEHKFACSVIASQRVSNVICK